MTHILSTSLSRIFQTLVICSAMLMTMTATDATNVHFFKNSPRRPRQLDRRKNRQNPSSLIADTLYYSEATGRGWMAEDQGIRAETGSPVTRIIPGNGVLTLLGDEGKTSSSNPSGHAVADLFIIRGTGPHSGTIRINGSEPVAFDGVSHLVVLGFEEPDTLDISPFMDKSRSWGIAVTYDQGPVEMEDLLIFNCVAGTAEDLSITPSGPGSGVLLDKKLSDGTPIASVMYMLNTNIIVNANAGDGDKLTLNGTDPGNPNTSGMDSFDFDLTRAGTAGQEWVKVTDTNGGAVLYNLQSFVFLNAIYIASLGGNDTIRVLNNGSVAVNVDGGLPAFGDAGVPPGDTLLYDPTGATGVMVVVGGTPGQGTITATNRQTVTFSGIETLFPGCAPNDLDAPTITCPSNIAQDAAPYTTSKTVSWPAPAVRDNCPGVVTSSCVPVSGSSFPVGTTTVTCKATDASGNMSAPCSFTVTVDFLIVIQDDTNGNCATIRTTSLSNTTGSYCWRRPDNTTFSGPCNVAFLGTTNISIQSTNNDPNYFSAGIDLARRRANARLSVPRGGTLQAITDSNIDNSACVCP